MRVGSIAEAGSFGGFLKRTSSPGIYYGITAAHCVPGGLIGMPVCSPSTIEVTARIARLVRYTKFCQPSDRMGENPTKESEVLGLLQRSRFHDCPTGIEFLDPNNHFQPKTGLLSGANLGVIVSSQFQSNSNLLHHYDQELGRSGYPIFSARASWLTRIDYSIFSCAVHR